MNRATSSALRNSIYRVANRTAVDGGLTSGVSWPGGVLRTKYLSNDVMIIATSQCRGTCGIWVGIYMVYISLGGRGEGGGRDRGFQVTQ